jgi:hypothetical protein
MMTVLISSESASSVCRVAWDARAKPEEKKSNDSESLSHDTPAAPDPKKSSGFISNPFLRLHTDDSGPRHAICLGSSCCGSGGSQGTK